MSIKKHRLTKKDVASIFRSGRSFHGNTIGLKVARAATGAGGVAVIVPVRVATKAVLRNTLRRKVSAVVRPLISRLDPAMMVVVSVRTATLPSSKELQGEVVAVLSKSGILNR